MLKSRIPRTAIIYDRSATQGYKAYQPDSENTFTEMMKPSFRVRMTLKHGFIAIIQSLKSEKFIKRL